jgi:hypothetical protein
MFMDAFVFLGIIVVVFGIMPILLRSNAVYILLTLCAGDLFAHLAARDVTQIISSAVTVNAPIYSIVQISLLVAVPLILLFLYKKTAGSTIFLQIIAAAVSVVVCFMLVTTSLPYDTQTVIKESDIYSTIQPYYSAAVAAGLFISIIYFWIQKPGHLKKRSKKHRS